jgi:hypothetical protein
LTNISHTSRFIIHIRSKCEGTVERQVMSVCLYLGPHCPVSPSTGRLGSSRTVLRLIHSAFVWSHYRAYYRSLKISSYCV